MSEQALNEQPRQRLALFLVAQTIDALRQQKIKEVEAYDAVQFAVHAVATHDPDGLVRHVDHMQKVHGFAPNIGGSAP